jgi:hypothetical protein
MTRERPFRLDETANPLGRPKGARNRAIVALEKVLEGDAESILGKAITLAQDGDPTAMRLCLDRLHAVAKGPGLGMERSIGCRASPLPCTVALTEDEGQAREQELLDRVREDMKRVGEQARLLGEVVVALPDLLRRQR